MLTTQCSHRQAGKPLLGLSTADDEQQESPKITTDPFMASRVEKTQARDKHEARNYGTALEEYSPVNNPDLYKRRKSWRGQSCIGYNSHMSFAKMNSKVNLKTIGVGLFLLASVFCLYKIWVLTQARTSQLDPISNELKMVNIFYRHGDRK